LAAGAANAAWAWGAGEKAGAAWEPGGG